MSAATELKLIEELTEENAPAIYVTGGLQKFLDAVTAEVSTEVPDTTTRKGRERIASLAAKVSKSKTAVEKPGREYLKRLKELPKVVEAELRAFTNSMDALRDATRKPLDDWQAAEDARVDRHQAVIDELNERGAEAGTYDADYLRNSIAAVEAVVIGEHLEEFEAEAARAKDKALTALRAALVAREKQEAEQAELAELRRQQAERDAQDERDRIAREAAEKARLEEELKAQAYRDTVAREAAEAEAAAKRRELELQLQAQQAENEKLEAQQRAEQAERDAQAKADAAAAAERQRQADEQARLQREADAREADIAHKTAVLSSIKQSFMRTGITEEQAKAVINMIRKG